MRKLKMMLGTALLGGALLLTGCSSKVSKTCTTSMMGMDMNVTYSAPSENGTVDSVEVSIVIPTSMLQLAGIDTSDKSAVEEFVNSTFGEELDDNTPVDVKIENEKVYVSAKAGREDIQNIAGTSTGGTFKEVTDAFEKSGMFACR